ncbi:MAG TPA: hypothetical protein VML96_12695 [Egibacteraceae bacterium]|nr:hypothetical protein [Egibacteraceae bacterium]
MIESLSLSAHQHYCWASDRSPPYGSLAASWVREGFEGAERVLSVEAGRQVLAEAEPGRLTLAGEVDELDLSPEDLAG